jgi:hypothetical protein
VAITSAWIPIRLVDQLLYSVDSVTDYLRCVTPRRGNHAAVDDQQSIVHAADVALDQDVTPPDLVRELERGADVGFRAQVYADPFSLIACLRLDHNW